MSCPDELAGQQASCPKCGTVVQVPAPQAAASGSGQRLGDFSIVRKIGEGGMGAVYEAVQVGINRRVALKVLSPKLKEKPAFLERFRREARAAGALNHPNMVTVYEAGEVQGHHYLAMEYVDGETLRDRLKRTGKFAMEESLIIVRYVAEAIDCAWNHGKIIHRDIKPENIMLTREGHVKVADLGLAKSIEEDTTVTAVGAGIGTPAYMAPEQSKSARDVDCRADIYSLGVTLFEMLTGQLPFQGDTPQAMVTAHLEQPLPAPRSLSPELPKGVCDLVRRMCEKNAAHRYQTAAELIGDIDAVRAGGEPATPVPATSAAAASRRRRSSARKSPVPMIMGLVLVLGVGGVLGYLFLQKKDSGGKGSAGKGAPAEGPAEAKARRTFDRASDYAKSHPTHFREIIRRFEEAKADGRGTSYAAEADKEIKTWKQNWADAANTEFEERKALVASHLAAGAFRKAREAWEEFPEELRLGQLNGKILEEQTQVEKALRGTATRLREEMAPVLKKAPEQLTAQDFEALTATQQKVKELRTLLVKKEAREDGLPDALKLTLDALSAEVTKSLSGYRGGTGAKTDGDWGKLWEDYRQLVKARKLDEAVALCEKSRRSLGIPPPGGSEAEAGPPAGGAVGELAGELDLLAADARSLKDVFGKSEQNLPALKGRTVRIGGATVTVSEVKGEKFYVRQDKVEMAWGIEKLDLETILFLGVSSETDPMTIARKKAIFAYYYLDPDQSVQALTAAKEAGVDVSFYLSRLRPVLVVSTTPSGAAVQLEQMIDGEWSEAPAKSPTTPLQQEVSSDATYRVTVSKGSYVSVSREVKTGAGGEVRLRLLLKRAPSVSAPREGSKADADGPLAKGFGVPRSSRDEYGNPVRSAKDQETGLPLEIRHKKTSIHLVLIPAGQFMMGSPVSEPGRGVHEGPQRLVRITKPFYMGKYEVTQKQWKVLMSRNPSKFRNSSNPVEQVSWNDCQQFLKGLNREADPRQDQRFVLPTEAQWEYACRAGTKARFCHGDDPGPRQFGAYAWYKSNSDGKSRRVGQKRPSSWSLYDMHGNVWEWCQDGYGEYSSGAVSDPRGPADSELRMFRGGSWANDPASCRSAVRGGRLPEYAGHHLGFRVALTIPPSWSSRAGTRTGEEELPPQIVGTWAVAYSSNEFRIYRIERNWTASWVQTGRRGRIRRKGKDLQLDLGGDSIERIGLTRGELRIEHFASRSQYPLKPTATALGRKSITPKLAQVVGTWTITYSHGAQRTYMINRDGSAVGVSPAFGGERGGTAYEKGGCLLLDFAEDAVERLWMVGDRLCLERFRPKSTYGEEPKYTAVGRRRE